MARFKFGSKDPAGGDAKSRAVIFFLAIIIISSLLIGYLLYRKHVGGIKSSATLSGTPGIESVPGVGTTTTEYEKLQEQQNIQQAQKAEQTGTSAVPTITRVSYFGPSEFQSNGTRPGCTPDEIRSALAAGVTAEELRCKGCSLAQLRAGGYTAGEMAAAGFRANDLKNAGYSPIQLRQAGFNPAELKQAGFNAGQLSSAGYSPADLAQAGFSPTDLSSAGINPSALTAAGIGVAPPTSRDCSVAALQRARAQGVPASSLKKIGCSAGALRAAGYDVGSLPMAGFTPEDLKTAGFTPQELRSAGLTAGQLRRAGWNANDLKNAGFTPAELKNAGFNAAALKNAGYTPNDLKNGGYSSGDLLRAGYNPSDALPANGTTVAGTPAGPPTGIPGSASIPSVGNSEIQLAQLQAQQEQQLNDQQRAQRLAQVQSSMVSQANSLFTTWTPPAIQQYVEGEPPKEVAASTTTTSTGAATTTTTSTTGANTSAVTTAAGTPLQCAYVKAGDIMMAVLTSTVNSDENSPVMATIVSGKLRGAQLIGQFTLLKKKVLISFNKMNMPGKPASVGINAVAIDPETAHTALADCVNNHYLLRYGTLFASSFLSGLADAISQQGSQTSISSGGILVTHDPLSTGQTVAVALGAVGSQYASVLGSNFTRPPTVFVYAGNSIGVLFMQDLSSEQVPRECCPNEDRTCARLGGAGAGACSCTNIY